ncbi:helix-turn-helix domain-containing protein [Aidingimonas halophila]|uniref:Transcriptional regulator, AraC family n=1 Tax=Aidingimonas halophila TaxID=574349 RepID=A0A1H2WW12_9GAMM|nr:helix-turn-helix domain-containing protein [Aidingimonas halophila]GHC27603.1 AraC family transcriptional regulator [Aidingimonas halophila]SDW84159.1 transcriptional regulator, AraC family [Aidingimonas halophila]
MVDPDTIPAVRFDSEALEVNERFDAWREAIAPVFDVEPLSDATPEATARFESRIEAFSLGDMLAANVYTSAQRFHHARPNHRVDHLLVQVHRQGGYYGQLDETTVEVAPRHVSLIDLDRPLHTESGNTDIINVMLPRDLFSDHPAFIDGAHGLVLDPSRGAFLADYLAALMRRLPSVKTHEAPELTRITRDMLLACCAEDASARARVQQPVHDIARQRLEHFIERHLTSPRLTPATLCRTAAISRSRLYRLFEHEGGVLRYIQRRRLARARECLENPLESRAIGELAEAHGFRSQAHFSRSFRERYRCSPNEARDLARASRTLPDADAGTTVNHWIRQLYGR